MNSSEFDRQDDSQMISPKSRLDDNHARDDVRVDENSHDGDKRGTITGTDINTMNRKDTLVHALNHSSCSGDKMEKDHTQIKRAPDEKSGPNSKSNTMPPAPEATLPPFHARINIEGGESCDVNVIGHPPTAIPTSAGVSETSLPSYYTDNIAAACAATNDELASGVQSGGSSKAEVENISETKRRQKRARHRRQTSSTEDKVTKRTFEHDVVPQNTPASSAVSSLVMAELQRENLALVQENAALKQNVQYLSYMLERSLATPPRGDFNALLAQAALLQQQSALAPQILTARTNASVGTGSIGGLQHASDPQVASLLGVGGESSQEQHVHAELQEQRLRVASILSAMGSNNLSTSMNPLAVSSVLTGAEIPSLSGGQSSSILEQILLGGNPSASKMASTTATTLVGGGGPTPPFSDLQRYLLEGRGNSSLGGSFNKSHSSSLKGSVTAEPVGIANATAFSSNSQAIAATGAPTRHGLASKSPPAFRGPASTQSRSKRNKHRGGKHS